MSNDTVYCHGDVEDLWAWIEEAIDYVDRFPDDNNAVALIDDYFRLQSIFAKQYSE